MLGEILLHPIAGRRVLSNWPLGQVSRAEFFARQQAQLQRRATKANTRDT
jgi:hypothetical protein